MKNPTICSIYVGPVCFNKIIWELTLWIFSFFYSAQCFCWKNQGATETDFGRIFFFSQAHEGPSPWSWTNGSPEAMMFFFGKFRFISWNPWGRTNFVQVDLSCGCSFKFLGTRALGTRLWGCLLSLLQNLRGWSPQKTRQFPAPHLKSTKVSLKMLGKSNLWIGLSTTLPSMASHH